jgi:hypothetical protein
VGDGVVTSGDGVNWAAQACPTTNALNGIAYADNTFVAVGLNGTVVRSAAVPSSPLRLAPLPYQQGRSFAFTAAGPPGSSWEIDASTDLLGWTPLVNVWSTSSASVFTDQDAPFYERRFYRGEWW